MAQIKPTNRDPISPQSEKFEKDFKKTMIKTGAPPIREANSMLSEVEQSLKKKIWSLAKMESLVFSDPKLSAVYEEMAENGEEKYGYHYNETIQNMIFNDYVLNSPKYLQKYKMAIPKEKKRRDKSGINQLKKTGQKKMDATGTKIQKPKEIDEEMDNDVTKVVFLVNERDPKDPDLFAYFPEEIHNGEYRTAYSHIGQHSSAHPDYAKESRQASPEEYANLKAELEGLGYNLEILNGMQESTSAGSAGGAAGYVGYAGPAAFSSKGDLSGDFKGKNKKKSTDPKAKPISTGFALRETNYLTDPSGFEKYVKMLDESSSHGSHGGEYESPLGFKDDIKNISKELDTEEELKDLDTIREALPGKEKRAYGKHLPSGKNVSSAIDKPAVNKEVKKPYYKGGKVTSPFKTGNEKVSGTILAKHSQPERIQESVEPLNEYLMQDALFDKEIVDSKPRTGEHPFTMGNNGDKYEYMTVKFADGSQNIGVYSYRDDVFYDYMKWRKNMGIDENNIDEKAKSKSQQRFMGMVNAYKNGELGGDDVSAEIERAADSMTDKEVDDFARTKHKGLPDHVDESAEINPAYTHFAIHTPTGEIINGWDYSDIDGDELRSFKKDYFFVDIIDMEYDPKEVSILTPRTLQKRGINPFDVNNWHKTTNDMKETEQTIDETLGQHDIDYLMKAFEIVNSGPHYDPTKAEQFRTNIMQMSDAEAQQTYRRFEDMLRKMGYTNPQDVMNFQNNIKEDTQTMIQNNGTSMSNKAQATGDMSSEVPMGAQQTSGLQEADLKLFEDINNELKAFSIHHDKLKLMAEDKKTPSMVLGDRLRAENPKNFKKDMQNSDTKDVIDVEKELQWKDQQTDVGTDPQKLGTDIEKQEIKNADMNSDEALKNVGDSTNNDGDEVPKRNLTTKEQEEVNLYRNGQHSLNYDNEPDERFVERMKADQGEFFEMGEKQKEFKKDAPMYDKDTQPIEDGIDKVQFDKNNKKKGDNVAWNERMGIESNMKLAESMITGRYIDILGKRRLMEFRLGEVKEVKKINEDAMKLSFDGLGNTYMSKTVDKKPVVNEGVVDVMAMYQFYTDGKGVFAIQNPVQKLTEGEVKEKPVVNEQMDKMKHLLGYKPSSYVDTTNVKKNRKF